MEQNLEVKKETLVILTYKQQPEQQQQQQQQEHEKEKIKRITRIHDMSVLQVNAERKEKSSSNLGSNLLEY